MPAAKGSEATTDKNDHSRVQVDLAASGAAASNAQLRPPPPKPAKADHVDYLVKEIKENLKLGQSLPASETGLKVRSHLSHRRSHHRSSPYAVPPSSRACDTGNCGTSPTSATLGAPEVAPGPSKLRKWNQRRRYPSTCMNNNGGKMSGGDPDDPFEMLQELITDGSLIKEAVRRLQLGLAPKYTASKRDFYDSADEECCTPPPQTFKAAADLCCEVGI